MPKRRVRNGTAIKEKIIQEATRLFGARGFDGVALRDVAEACGTALSTLSHHFVRKQSLEEAVTRRAFDIVMEALTISLEIGKSPQQRLEKYIANMVALFLSDMPEIKLIDREFQSLDREFIRDAAIKSIKGNPASLAAIIQELDPNILARIPAKRLSDMVFSLIYGLTKLRPIHHYETGAQYATQDAITRDVCLIFTRALHQPNPAPDDNGQDDYFTLLGHFIHECSILQEIVQLLLMRQAKPSRSAVDAWLAGIRRIEVDQQAALLRQVYGIRANSTLDLAIGQFLIIMKTKTEILEQVTRVRDVNAFVSSHDSTTFQTAVPYFVAGQTLRAMTYDLQSIRCALLLLIVEKMPGKLQMRRRLRHTATRTWKFERPT